MASLRRFPHHTPFLSPPFHHVRRTPSQSWSLRSPPSRAFHCSRPHQYALIEPLLTTTQTLITGLHTITGLSWAVSLPLTAFLIRLTIILPSTYYSHLAQQRQLALQPLSAAWSSHLQQTLPRETPGFADMSSRRKTLSIRLATWRKRREIWKRWQCGLWKSLIPAMHLPLYLVVLETLRRMCGAREGLLSLIAQPFRSASQYISTRFFPEATPLDPYEDSETFSTSTDVTTTPIDPLRSSYIDPTLSTEGALWFPNLLLPDPQLLLPFILSGLLLSSIHSANRTRTRHGRELTRLQTRLGRSAMLLALAIGPMTLQLPSALLVYWISSQALGVAQTWLLDRVVPLRPGPTIKPVPEEAPMSIR
ncbi:MAG: hypothetical protein M1817_003957 [Caeruleum heppii]|nr:MAG: hypothetical protein M1817_003957 [Caeruleum heppii]